MYLKCIKMTENEGTRDEEASANRKKEKEEMKQLRVTVIWTEYIDTL